MHTSGHANQTPEPPTQVGGLEVAVDDGGLVLTAVGAAAHGGRHGPTSHRVAETKLHVEHTFCYTLKSVWNCRSTHWR